MLEIQNKWIFERPWTRYFGLGMRYSGDVNNCCLIEGVGDC